MTVGYVTRWSDVSPYLGIPIGVREYDFSVVDLAVHTSVRPSTVHKYGCRSTGVLYSRMDSRALQRHTRVGAAHTRRIQPYCAPPGCTWCGLAVLWSWAVRHC